MNNCVIGYNMATCCGMLFVIYLMFVDPELNYYHKLEQTACRITFSKPRYLNRIINVKGTERTLLMLDLFNDKNYIFP